MYRWLLPTVVLFVFACSGPTPTPTPDVSHIVCKTLSESTHYYRDYDECMARSNEPKLTPTPTPTPPYTVVCLTCQWAQEIQSRSAHR